MIEKKRMFGATVFFLLTAGIVVTAVNTKTSTTSPPNTQSDTTTTKPETALQCFSCNASLEEINDTIDKGCILKIYIFSG